MAKLFATDTANRVACPAVQMRGRYGCMRELPVQHVFREIIARRLVS